MKLTAKQLKALIKETVSEQSSGYIIRTLLDRLVNKFIESRLGAIKSMPREMHDEYHSEVINIAQEMKQELLHVIEKYEKEIEEL